jgi:hypothetical protein
MRQSRYIVGFIRKKRKARVRELQRSPEAGGWGFYGCFNSGLGGFFSLAMDSWAFSGELVWFAPLLGEGNNLEHFAHQPCGRSVSLL